MFIGVGCCRRELSRVVTDIHQKAKELEELKCTHAATEAKLKEALMAQEVSAPQSVMHA